MGFPRRHTDIFSDSELGDFVIRRRIPPMWQLFILFFLCFSVLFLVALNAESLGGAVGVGLATFAVIGPLTWFTVYFNQRNGDMVLAAEFQNALFSAAARLKSKFCLIVKKDGTVFYYDRGFQKIFPDTAHRGTLMIDKIFDSKTMPASEAQKLFRAMERNTSETVFMDITDEEGKPQKVIINIDVLPRPQGFFILRGRDYVAKQYDRTNAGHSLPVIGNAKVSATLMDMIHTLPYGIYSTDADGNLLFVNYRLENWLGFAQNELVNQNKNLSDILTQQNTEIEDDLLLRNCEGELQFKTKQDRSLKLHIQQEISKDARGAVIGSVAFIKPDAPLQQTAKPASADLRIAPSASLTKGKSF